MNEPSGNPSGNGWGKWENFVLMKLDEINDTVKENRTQHIVENKELRDAITDMKSDISALKIKAGIWGAAGGAIPIGIAILVWVMQSLAGG